MKSHFKVEARVMVLLAALGVVVAFVAANQGLSVD